MKRTWLLCALAFGLASSARAQPVELRESVLEHIREIRARNPDLRDDAFSKMGGSSVASTAFLRCLSTPYVELGNRPELAAALEYFGTGRRSSFNRESEAAGVSWNLRYVLGGRPASFRQEVGATQGRWALVLFGSNDAQNQNERIYLRRLVYLVERLEEMAVVAVLGSALPRRNRTKNRWIMRFNAITEAVAEHWALPYIDYHGALSALPRQGLARDGVHPNVLGKGGVRAACQFTEKGLRYGNNVRNLLTLEMLEALRRSVEGVSNPDTDTGTDAGTDTDTGTDAGAGTDTQALAWGRRGGDEGPTHRDSASRAEDQHTRLPTSRLLTKPDLPVAETLPKYCGVPKPGSRLYRTRFDLSERTRLRVSALDLDGYRPRVLWVRIAEEGPQRCVRRRLQTLEVDAQPGMWDLIVEVPARAAVEGKMLILMTRNPR